MWFEDEGIDPRFLVHDHDTKLAEAFDEQFESVVKTPYCSPIANCFAEFWIANLKRECRNHLFCFSLGHVNHIVQSYARYYNTMRPHQGMGNVPLNHQGEPATRKAESPLGHIHRTRILGGLLSHYCRNAA